MDLTPRFKLVFVSVLCITGLSLLLGVSLALYADPANESVKPLIDTCSTTFKMGFGAIVGLLGGKTL